MIKARWVMVVSAMALVAGASLAQGGPSGAKGPGPGASAAGMGPGMHAGRGPGRSGADYTPGWAMMTPQERSEHQARMRSMKAYGECQAYQQQHHEQMAARAKEKGGQPLGQPRRDACAGLKR